MNGRRVYGERVTKSGITWLLTWSLGNRESLGRTSVKTWGPSHAWSWSNKRVMSLMIEPAAAAAAAKSLQSCPTLCDPTDGSPPDSAVPGVLQARTLEGVAISSSNAWKWKVKVKSLSHVRLLVTPWTAAYQAPPSVGFCRQEHWSGVPLPSLNDWT